MTAASPSTFGRGVRRLTATVTTGAALAACAAVPVTGSAAPSPDVAPTSGAVSLAGWRLTLPQAGKKGAADVVDPAAATPPWLGTDAGGGLVFWAPVDGATTKHSEHARTELVDRATFAAGKQRRSLTATVAVAQVPADPPDVIIGQIHGADTINSVPFVMLHYDAGAVTVVVKQQRSGSAAQKLTLLSGVALRSRFAFGITDDGNGNLTFTARDGTRHATADAAVPTAFQGAPVRFQAGAYQQGRAGGTSGDGARLTFSALATAAG